MPSTVVPDKTDVQLGSRPSRASEIMRYGYPGFDSLTTFEDYVASYDRRNRYVSVHSVDGHENLHR